VGPGGPTDAEAKVRAYFARFNETRESPLEALHPAVDWHIRADLPGSRTLHGYEDIKANPQLKVAIVSGADQIDFLHAMGIPDSQIVMIQANADALSTVKTGRADAYAATELTVAELVTTSGDAGVEQAKPFTDPVVNGKPARSYGGFDFRPEDKELYKAFNDELVKFKKTDAYAKILTSYGLSQESVDAARAKTMEDLCAGK